MESREHQSDRTVIQRCGLVVGLIALVAILSLPTPETFTAHTAERATLPTDHPEVVRIAGGLKATLALVAIMVVWWVTEAVPLPITALLPGVLLPTLHVAGLRDGALFDYDAKAAFASFANPVIYLFLAGFLLAGAMRKTGLDRRITLSLLSWSPVMRGPGRILLAVMAITAFLSMWVSNTATTAMMLPIGLTILTQLDQKPGRSPYAAVLASPSSKLKMLPIAASSSVATCV